MDSLMEDKIAQAFAYKNKRERFLFELKKRNRLSAICKLPTIVDESLGMNRSNSLPPPEDIIRIMQNFGVQDKCYVLSEYSREGYDGVYLPLKNVVEALNTNGFPALIVGLPSGFSHLRDESYASHQPNYFLKPSKRFDGLNW